MTNSSTDTSRQHAAKDADMDARGSGSGHLTPVRRGSEFSDVLLRSLDNLLLNRAEPVVIGITGCRPRQGVTTTAINLAIRAADHGRGPVLLIDGNAKNKRLSRLYRCSKQGYGDCLAGASELDASVKQTKVRDLSVLGVGDSQLAGQIVPDPNCASAFFAEVRDSYRLTVVDMPLFANPSAAASLCPYLDGILAVAQPGVASSELAQLKDSVRQFNGKLLGVVMTGAQGSAMPKWLQRFFR